MLQISNLSFSYQGQTILNRFNLTLTDHGVVAIIGDNGVGKTTLLRLIAGELQPDDGNIQTRGEVGFLHQTQEDLQEKSGGERTQSRLSELFRQRPQILLLDEPTNNLDYDSKMWLLRNLRTYRGLVLVVSHDRDFLEAVAEQVIYLHGKKVDIFLGNYACFRKRLMQEQDEKRQNYEHAQQEKRKLEKQLKNIRDRAHKSNRRSYNKINDESRMRYDGQRMAAQNSAGKILRATQSRLDQIDAVEKPVERKTYHAEVSSNFLHDKKLLEVTDLSKKYDKKILFHDLNFEVRTGDRVRISGRNGSGKSTLFQIILGSVKADQGRVWTALNLNIGYISQDVTGLDLQRSFLEQNQDFDKTEVFRAAATMDLTPQDINRPTYELSRGQLTKLAVLRLILSPLDLVIIDELTNHLDIRARENIELAFKDYRGAILVATHDEAFARELKLTKTISLD